MQYELHLIGSADKKTIDAPCPASAAVEFSRQTTLPVEGRLMVRNGNDQNTFPIEDGKLDESVLLAADAVKAAAVTSEPPIATAPIPNYAEPAPQYANYSEPPARGTFRDSDTVKFIARPIYAARNWMMVAGISILLMGVMAFLVALHYFTSREMYIKDGMFYLAECIIFLGMGVPLVRASVKIREAFKSAFRDDVASVNNDILAFFRLLGLAAVMIMVAMVLVIVMFATNGK